MKSNYISRMKKIWQDYKHTQLGLEISLILVIKLILLLLLWLACFSHPVSKEARQLVVTRTIMNQTH